MKSLWIFYSKKSKKRIKCIEVLTLKKVLLDDRKIDRWLQCLLELLLTECFSKRKWKSLQKKCRKFFKRLRLKPNVSLFSLSDLRFCLKEDIDFIYSSDPACFQREEIIHCYPGFYAVFVYRVAHFFSQSHWDLFARILSESAYRKTGIEIHPHAEIGVPFMIDHGNGVVIGETSEIGNYVKIYQGVILGSASMNISKKLQGCKRHPTIEDGVTIYAQTMVLGGDTVIGKNAVLGCHLVLTKSVAPNQKITLYHGQKNLDLL